MKKIICLGMILSSGMAFANKQSQKTLFQDGINAAVYGEGFMAVSSDQDTGKDLNGIKIGVQALRFNDYFSLAIGGVYAASKAGYDRDYFGPQAEAIIMPRYIVSLGLSYSSSEGSIAYDDPIFGEDKLRTKLKSNDFTSSLMLRAGEHTQLTVGYLINNSQYSVNEKQSNVKQKSVIMGIRATML